MPNWCDNSMRLYHEDKTKIDALEAEMSKKNDEGRSMAEPFNHLCPRPADQEENWYDWNCSNWGTKWDASIIDWCRDSDNELTIYCDTAWSPPIALYEYLTEQGWEVTAYYHEGGMAFCGRWNSEDGDDYYEYDITEADSIDSLPEDIIDFAGLEDAHKEWIESELYDQWGDAERTEWYDAKINPEREGYYEITTAGWDYPQFCEWTGDRWECYNEVVKWRGLAQDPSWDPVAELDKIVLDETEVD
jgi:hypothetical protein